jgi:hypothetical protein
MANSVEEGCKSRGAEKRPAGASTSAPTATPTRQRPTLPSTRSSRATSTTRCGNILQLQFMTRHGASGWHEERSLWIQERVNDCRHAQLIEQERVRRGKERKGRGGKGEATHLRTDARSRSSLPNPWSMRASPTLPLPARRPAAVRGRAAAKSAAVAASTTKRWTPPVLRREFPHGEPHDPTFRGKKNQAWEACDSKKRWRLRDGVGWSVKLGRESWRLL